MKSLPVQSLPSRPPWLDADKQIEPGYDRLVALLSGDTKVQVWVDLDGTALDHHENWLRRPWNPVVRRALSHLLTMEHVQVGVITSRSSRHLDLQLAPKWTQRLVVHASQWLEVGRLRNGTFTFEGRPDFAGLIESVEQAMDMVEKRLEQAGFGPGSAKAERYAGYGEVLDGLFDPGNSQSPNGEALLRALEPLAPLLAKQGLQIRAKHHAGVIKVEPFVSFDKADDMAEILQSGDAVVFVGNDGMDLGAMQVLRKHADLHGSGQVIGVYSRGVGDVEQIGHVSHTVVDSPASLGHLLLAAGRTASRATPSGPADGLVKAAS